MRFVFPHFLRNADYGFVSYFPSNFAVRFSRNAVTPS